MTGNKSWRESVFVCVCVCVCVVAGAVDGVAKLCSSRMWWCRVILKFGGGVCV